MHSKGLLWSQGKKKPREGHEKLVKEFCLEKQQQRKDHLEKYRGK